MPKGISHAGNEPHKCRTDRCLTLGGLVAGALPACLEGVELPCTTPEDPAEQYKARLLPDSVYCGSLESLLECAMCQNPACALHIPFLFGQACSCWHISVLATTRLCLM